VIGWTSLTRPAARRSARTRRPLLVIGVLAVLVAVLIVGCKGRTPVASETPAVEAPSSEPSESPTPTVAGSSIVTLSGTGDKTSDPFQATGESVEVTYSFTCSSPGAFTLNFYGTNGSAALPDVIVDDFGDKGADTVTESLNGASGPFNFDVVSACDWSVSVLGQP
jgi:hypothetical protein